MKNIKSLRYCNRHIVTIFIFFSIIGGLNSCNKDVLEEVPLSFLNPDLILVDKEGFETGITSILSAIRDGYYQNDGTERNFVAFHQGTDVNMTKDPLYRDYTTYVTPTMLEAQYLWDWAYVQVIPRTNIIIEYAEKPTAKWKDENEKNAIVAEAKFLRAYVYNVLANLYGGVPIVDQVYKEPKLDFVRASREDVFKFVAEDLEFASKWLPIQTTTKGRIVKAAADHLLAEVYISLGRYDDAIESATNVIGSGLYKLMTERFGNYINKPGDVFSDLFKDNNQNISSNTEGIWVFQIEYQTPGGGQYRGMRYWNCQYYNLKDPDGVSGMILVDSLGRPNGWTRGTPYVYHGLWSDRNDMRCSNYNFRWDFYYNNPNSNYFGQKVDPKTALQIDTMRTYYPTIRKLEGEALAGAKFGGTFVDQYCIRLAETYLLRAEAYLMKGEKQKAADDINVIRERAHAKPATADEMTIDYILDERMRELLVEEPRRLTLVRTGKLVERVKKYNPYDNATIQDFHEFFPIPQTAIDANIDAVLEQNPGYN